MHENHTVARVRRDNTSTLMEEVHNKSKLSSDMIGIDGQEASGLHQNSSVKSGMLETEPKYFGESAKGYYDLARMYGR